MSKTAVRTCEQRDLRMHDRGAPECQRHKAVRRAFLSGYARSTGMKAALKVRLHAKMRRHGAVSPRTFMFISYIKLLLLNVIEYGNAYSDFILLFVTRRITAPRTSTEPTT